MLNRLPMELWLQISLRLDPRSMKSLWTACRYYYFDVINRHPNFWKLLVIGKLGIEDPNRPDLPDEYWKDLFYPLNRNSDTILFNPVEYEWLFDPRNHMASLFRASNLLMFSMHGAGLHCWMNLSSFSSFRCLEPLSRSFRR